jgi:16S rRNA (guanine527-N7)-methyltransferase
MYYVNNTTHMVLTDTYIRRVLEPYGVVSSPEICEAVRKYCALLVQWNQKISLTAVRDPEQILRFHFGESLFAAAAVPIRGGRLADVGSGAGFPGLPLRIAIKNLAVTLIESNAKKATFLSEVIRELHLDHCDVFRGRMDSYEADNGARFDFIAARALGQHDAMLRWARRKLSPSGRVVLWLGEEVAAAISQAAGWSWTSPTLIPGADRRVLLVGSPL